MNAKFIVSHGSGSGTASWTERLSFDSAEKLARYRARRDKDIITIRVPGEGDVAYVSIDAWGKPHTDLTFAGCAYA